MKRKRKVAVFTGNRAEYGLQYPIIKAIADHPDLEYYLLVGGAHLQQDFGRTRGEIEADGFKVHAEVRMEMPHDTLYATAVAIGTGILSLSKILDDLKPDFQIVYADRFEGFSAVITSTQMGIPTAHVEGGDITEGGALDDMVRHAMTKLSHLHFTTNSQAEQRIARMGEEPWRIFNVGFPAIDLISEGKYASPGEVSSKYGLDTARPVLLFTQHSVTTEFESAVDQIRPSLEAMRILAEEGYQIIVTYPNNDAGGKAIIAEIKRFMESAPKGIQVFPSLGRYFYHGVLNVCGRVCQGACVGNSSSVIKEALAFGCPGVNIGSRQQGRLRGDNIIDAPYDSKEIVAACKRAVHDQDFRKVCAESVNPYGNGGVGKKIADIISTIHIDGRLIQKKMTY